MISFIFLCLGFGLGYWVRGTKAAVWVNKVLSKAEAVE